MNTIFKEGIKVYDYLYGWGEVINSTKGNCYPIVVKYKSDQIITYTLDGRLSPDISPTLSTQYYKNTEDIVNRAYDDAPYKTDFKKVPIGTKVYYLEGSIEEGEIIDYLEDRTFEVLVRINGLITSFTRDGRRSMTSPISLFIKEPFLSFE